MQLINEASLIDPKRVVEPDAWVGHIPFASWLISVLRPSIFVELGTHTGNSYTSFCQAIVQNQLPTRAYAVDTWKGDDHSGRYDESVFLDIKKYHDSLYEGFSTLMRMTFDEALDHFPDASIDLLHIDGLHTYEAVKHDFEAWRPKMSNRGVVLFHDTDVRDLNFGVYQLWDELSQSYPSFEFKHSYGLGVLLVGDERSPILLDIVNSDRSGNGCSNFNFEFFRVLGVNIKRRLFISNLTQSVAVRDSQIENLTQSVAVRDSQIENLTQSVAVRDSQIENLTQSVAVRDSQIENLTQSVLARDSQIENLTQSVAARDTQIENLNQSVVARDTQIDNVTVELSQILNSNSWMRMQLFNEASLIDPKRVVEPDAWVGHIPFASWLISQLRPTVFVELGTHTGNSYSCFCQSIVQNQVSTKAYAVDTWKGDEHSGRYEEKVFLDIKKHHDPLYESFSTLMRMTFDEALDHFSDGSIDLLHIDGLHTYQAVKHDFEAWYPKLSSRSVVLFHDTNVRDSNFGVYQLWDELSQSYPSFEFKHSSGLGVLLVGNERLPILLDIVKSSRTDDGCNSFDLELFRGLGVSIERRSLISNLTQTVAARDSQVANLNHAVGERDGQVANLKNAVAARDGQINNVTIELSQILNSKSWILTKPLRDLYLYLVRKPRRFIHLILSNYIRRIWHYLPIPRRDKQILKDKLFGRFPFVFRWSRAYRVWQILNTPSDGTYQSRPDRPSEPSSEAYVPLLDGLPPSNTPVRAIAFYLPQFHSIAENNGWWGDGFTEWTNTKPAKPQFEGHYQPHIPGDLGYYNLLDPSVQRKQIELAKLYGISGFCFYTYWFGGKLLLEKPLENYLNDSSLDLPFCLCWANENWSRRWDGLDSEILIAQSHSPKDDLEFIAYIAQYMRDERYIRVNGKPLLLVYRPSLLPSPEETAKRWRAWCHRNGIGDIYLAYTQSFETVNPDRYGFDAAIEFPPNNSVPYDISRTVKPLSEPFACTVYDWQIFVKRSRNYQRPNYRLYRSVCPSWDNTARRKNRGTVFVNSSPQGYQEWLTNAIVDTCEEIKVPNERLIFINAWNEWAEGAHLEPDQYFGYAYLDATRKAMLGEERQSKERVIVVSHDAHPHGAQFLALGMVRSLIKDLHLDIEVVLLGGGRLKGDFSALATVHDLSGTDLESSDVTHLSQTLAKRGFTRAIVNTTASGGIVPVFQKSGIECICLVHELPGVIRSNHFEKQTKQIAKSAKAIVFPAEIVAKGFSQFATVDQEKQFIRPQGLYRRNKWRYDKKNARIKLRVEMGLSPDAKIVLTVGYGDHRKGVDLFVECAFHILQKRSDVDFIWVGHWEPEIQKTIESKLSQSQYKNKIHFVGYNSNTALFHAGSDIYALTSREDPFPNVVLESFDVGVPVVAFSSTGGAAHLLEKVGGIVVPLEDTVLFSGAICQLLDTPELSSRLGHAARTHVDQHLAFRPYLFDLCDMLGITLPRVSVVVPNYNYAQYIEERLTSICGQSVPIFELIILDDASTDDSLQKIFHWLSLSQTDARVVVNKTNSGNVFSQWRKGILLASGQYLWIAEADDLSDPDFLEAVLPPFVSDDVVLSYCESQQITSAGSVLAKNYHDYLSTVSEEHWKNAYVEDGVEENKTALAIMNTIPNVSAVLFDLEAIDSVFSKYFDEISSFKKGGDWVVYFRTLFLGNIAFIPRSANRHRRHEGSVIGGSERQSLVQEIAQIQDIIIHESGASIEVQGKAMAYRETLQSMT